MLWFKKKVVPEVILTPAQKTEIARKNISDSFTLFHAANHSINKANAMLEEAKMQAVQERDNLLLTLNERELDINSIDNEKNANLALQESLKPFVV